MLNINSRQILLCFLAAAFLVGCNPPDLEDNNLDESSFIKITGTPLKIEILGVPRITMVDNLILSINQSGKKVFSLIDPNEQKIVNEYGELNQFPEEYSFPIFPGEIIPKKPSHFTVHDLDKNEYFEYKLEGNEFELLSKERINFNGEYFPNFVGIKSDSLTIYSPEHGGLLVIYKNTPENANVIDYFPIPNSEIKDIHKWMAYQASIAINLEKKLIAINSLLFGELDIFNFEGELINRVIYDTDNHLSDDFKAENITATDLKRYAIDIQASEKSIFILIEGNSYNDIRDKKQIQNSKILEYDWEGNFINGYLLDRPILSIAYDDKNSRIFGTSLIKEEEVIIEFKLN